MKNYFKSFRVIVLTLTLLAFNYVNAQVTNDDGTTKDTYTINTDQSSNNGMLRLRNQNNNFWDIHNSSGSLIFKYNNANQNTSITMNTGGNMSFGSTTRQMINLWNTSYGIGIQSSTQYFRSDANFAWYKGGTHNSSELNNGGGTTLMTLEDNGDLTVSGNVVTEGAFTAQGTVEVDKAGGDLLKMAYGSGDYGGMGFTANGPYFRTPETFSNSGLFSIVNGNNISQEAIRVTFDGSSSSTQIYNHLMVGPDAFTSASIRSNTVAHFDGRVYISEEAGTEQGFGTTSGSNYNDFLLWVEEGIVSKDFALAETSDWPDYVFEENYDLTSIEDLENHIKTKGYLHTMPSAAEIESKGFTVSDMTKRTVRTVEELTLHTIAQEKRIKEQEDLIAKLMVRLTEVESALNK